MSHSDDNSAPTSEANATLETGRPPRKRLVFTLTAGRTGTKFLASLFAKNFPDAECHHERVSYESFGVDTPDLSHLLLYNSQGNVPKVQAFWKQKLDRIAQAPGSLYVETSHVNMKAGLVENVASWLPEDVEAHFIFLARPPVEIVMSLGRRFDMVSFGNNWVWYLDHEYPRNLLKPRPFLEYGLDGVRFWYVNEIRLRAAYFRQKYADHPRMKFHNVMLAQLNDEDLVRTLFDRVGVPLTDVSVPPATNRNTQGNVLSDAQKRNLKALAQMSARFAPAKAAAAILDRERNKDREAA